MAKVPFQLKLLGESADDHEFQGYDGYMALAGFAWTLSLASNYVETRQIRVRGDFPGREAVRATALRPGSIIADFIVHINQSPELLLGAGLVAPTPLLHGLVKRIIGRSLGKDEVPSDPRVAEIVETRSGDVEALVARSEPAIRQTHNIIGNGASALEIRGGVNLIDVYNYDTKEYVRLNIEDKKIKEKQFSISAFNVNSGYGSVYDSDLNRVVPFSMNRDVLQKVGPVMSWGLDQYANKTGGTVRVKYNSILSADGTPKRYVVTSAFRGAKLK